MTGSGQAEVLCPVARLQEQVRAILQGWKLSAACVEAATNGLSYADLHGIDSHGVAMVPIYEKWLNQGRFNLNPQPRATSETSVTALIDGDHSMGFLPANLAMDMAIEKARNNGVAVVCVNRSNHFGAAGQYVRRAADQGLIGFAASNTVDVAVVPTGGRDSRFGTNPLAFAAPAAGQRPFLLDMATSTVALGKLMAAQYRGESIPEGWALDELGQPTTDPARGYAARRATPLGGTANLSSHKGYGLAAMVEILSSALTGARWAPDSDSDPSLSKGNVGHCFMVLDPSLFRGKDELEHAVGRMMRVLRDTPSVVPDQPVKVAGDPEYEASDLRQVEGIHLPSALALALRGVAQRAGARWLLN